MTITTVFLDLYQTLIYFHPAREQRQAQALEELGFQVEEEALRRAYLAADHYYTLASMEEPLHRRDEDSKRRVYTRYQQVLLEEMGLSHAVPLAERIYRRYWELARELRLFPDVEPTLARLKEAGYRLGMITNVTGDPVADLERVGLKDRFDVVVASCVVGFEKPDPRIFRVALEALEAAPHQAVHVGDQFLADVEGAKAAGLQAVLLDRHGLQDGLHPHRIRSLSELAPLLRNGLA